MNVALLQAFAVAATGLSSQTGLHSRLRGNTVYRATDLAPVDVTSGWNAAAGERAVAVFFRSFG